MSFRDLTKSSSDRRKSLLEASVTRPVAEMARWAMASFSLAIASGSCVIVDQVGHLLGVGGLVQLQGIHRLLRQPPLAQRLEVGPLLDHRGVLLVQVGHQVLQVPGGLGLDPGVRVVHVRSGVFDHPLDADVVVADLPGAALQVVGLGPGDGDVEVTDGPPSAAVVILLAPGHGEVVVTVGPLLGQVEVLLHPGHGDPEVA